MSDQTITDTRLSDGSRGFLMALAAYGLWGALPFYLKALGHIPAMEVVSHRVIWSVPVALLLLLALGQFKGILSAVRQPRMLAMAALTAGLITINWSIYVWAVAHDQVMGAALGYYINPLFNVVLGGLFLGERLTRVQYVAVGLAFAAVILLTVNAGGLPWVSLALPLTFGLYGFSASHCQCRRCRASHLKCSSCAFRRWAMCCGWPQTVRTISRPAQRLT